MLDLMQTPDKHQHAVLRILKVLPTNLVLSASVLGAIALTIAAGPVGAVALVTGVGVTIFTDLVKKIAGGAQIANDEILLQVQRAIDESDVTLKIAGQNQNILARLLKESHLIEVAMKQGDYDILAQLAKATGQIAELKEALRGEFAALDDHLEMQATSLEDIREMQRNQSHQIEGIRQFLEMLRELYKVAVPTPATLVKGKLFLSYARSDDEPFVKRLYESLVAQGFDVWWDRVSMPNRGLKFGREIGNAIQSADRLLLVSGPRAVISEYVRAEWKFALSSCKPIHPLLRLCEYEELPADIGNFDARDFRDDTKFEAELMNLVRQISDVPAPLGKLIGVPGLPDQFQARPADLDTMKAYLISGSDKIGISSTPCRAGMQGMGGIGKSVLASALVNDCEVRLTFPDGIYWVALGQTPYLTVRQKTLCDALGRSVNIINDVEEGKSKLSEALSDKKCLIVLDDVWTLDHVRAFETSGTTCSFLLTSRNAEIIDSFGAKKHELGVLSEEDALSLMARWLIAADELPTVDSETELHQIQAAKAAMPSEAHQVARKCGYLPLGLVLSAAQVRDGMSWNSILSALEDAELDYLDNANGSLLASIKVSVDALAHENRSDAKHYLELAIFPEETEIPESAIMTLWLHTNGLKPHTAEKLLVKLSRRSMLRLDGKTPDRRVRLHDLQGDYLRIALENIDAVHLEMINAYQKKCSGVWHMGPNDGYFFQHLAYHLYHAGQKDELYKLLTVSPDWMESKFEACSGDAAYVADLNMAMQLLKDPLSAADVLVLTQLYTARQVVNTRANVYLDSDLEILVWLEREAEALNHAQLRPDPIAKAVGLRRIYDTLCERDGRSLVGHQIEVRDQMLQAARDCPVGRQAALQESCTLLRKHSDGLHRAVFEEFLDGDEKHTQKDARQRQVALYEFAMKLSELGETESETLFNLALESPTEVSQEQREVLYTLLGQLIRREQINPVLIVLDKAFSLSQKQSQEIAGQLVAQGKFDDAITVMRYHGEDGLLWMFDRLCEAGLYVQTLFILREIGQAQQENNDKHENDPVKAGINQVIYSGHIVQLRDLSAGLVHQTFLDQYETHHVLKNLFYTLLEEGQLSYAQAIFVSLSFAQEILQQSKTINMDWVEAAERRFESVRWLQPARRVRDSLSHEPYWEYSGELWTQSDPMMAARAIPNALKRREAFTDLATQFRRVGDPRADNLDRKLQTIVRYMVAPKERATTQVTLMMQPTDPQAEFLIKQALSEGYAGKDSDTLYQTCRLLASAGYIQAIPFYVELLNVAFSPTTSDKPWNAVLSQADSSPSPDDIMAFSPLAILVEGHSPDDWEGTKQQGEVFFREMAEAEQLDKALRILHNILLNHDQWYWRNWADELFLNLLIEFGQIEDLDQRMWEPDGRHSDEVCSALAIHLARDGRLDEALDIADGMDAVPNETRDKLLVSLIPFLNQANRNEDALVAAQLIVDRQLQINSLLDVASGLPSTDRRIYLVLDELLALTSPILRDRTYFLEQEPAWYSISLIHIAVEVVSAGHPKAEELVPQVLQYIHDVLFPDGEWQTPLLDLAKVLANTGSVLAEAAVREAIKVSVENFDPDQLEFALIRVATVMAQTAHPNLKTTIQKVLQFAQAIPAESEDGVWETKARRRILLLDLSKALAEMNPDLADAVTKEIARITSGTSHPDPSADEYDKWIEGLSLPTKLSENPFGGSFDSPFDVSTDQKKAAQSRLSALSTKISPLRQEPELNTKLNLSLPEVDSNMAKSNLSFNSPSASAKKSESGTFDDLLERYPPPDFKPLINMGQAEAAVAAVCDVEDTTIRNILAASLAVELAELGNYPETFRLVLSIVSKTSAIEEYESVVTPILEEVEFHAIQRGEVRTYQQVIAAVEDSNLRSLASITLLDHLINLTMNDDQLLSSISVHQLPELIQSTYSQALDSLLTLTDYLIDPIEKILGLRPFIFTSILAGSTLAMSADFDFRDEHLLLTRKIMASFATSDIAKTSFDTTYQALFRLLASSKTKIRELNQNEDSRDFTAEWQVEEFESELIPLLLITRPNTGIEFVLQTMESSHPIAAVKTWINFLMMFLFVHHCHNLNSVWNFLDHLDNDDSLSDVDFYLAMSQAFHRDISLDISLNNTNDTISLPSDILLNIHKASTSFMWDRIIDQVRGFGKSEVSYDDRYRLIESLYKLSSVLALLRRTDDALIVAGVADGLEPMAESLRLLSGQELAEYLADHEGPDNVEWIRSEKGDLPEIVSLPLNNAPSFYCLSLALFVVGDTRAWAFLEEIENVAADVNTPGNFIDELHTIISAILFVAKRYEEGLALAQRITPKGIRNLVNRLRQMDMTIEVTHILNRLPNVEDSLLVDVIGELPAPDALKLSSHISDFYRRSAALNQAAQNHIRAGNYTQAKQIISSITLDVERAEAQTALVDALIEHGPLEDVVEIARAIVPHVQRRNALRSIAMRMAHQRTNLAKSIFDEAIHAARASQSELRVKPNYETIRALSMNLAQRNIINLDQIESLVSQGRNHRHYDPVLAGAAEEALRSGRLNNALRLVKLIWIDHWKGPVLANTVRYLAEAGQIDDAFGLAKLAEGRMWTLVAHCALAVGLAKMGDSRAAGLLDTVIQKAQSSQMRRWQHNALRHCAVMLLQIQDSRGEAILQDAIQAARILSSTHSQIDALCTLAMDLYALGNKQAETLFDQAIDLVSEMDPDVLSEKYLNSLSLEAYLYIWYNRHLIERGLSHSRFSAVYTRIHLAAMLRQMGKQQPDVLLQDAKTKIDELSTLCDYDTIWCIHAESEIYKHPPSPNRIAETLSYLGTQPIGELIHIFILWHMVFDQLEDGLYSNVIHEMLRIIAWNGLDLMSLESLMRWGM